MNQPKGNLYGRDMRLILIRTALLLGAVAAILAMMPRAGHQSFSYELNQPWKYHLLTAEFDIPVLRDKASAERLRDSIERSFVPFVVIDHNAAGTGIGRFRSAMEGKADAADMAFAIARLKDVYAQGILQQALYDSVIRRSMPQLHTLEDNSDNPTTATFIDVSGMRSPATALQFIDSMYRSAHAGQLMTADMAKGLSMALIPNVIADSSTNEKFRSQELLRVNAALGIIKKGQRIVDLGEIVTPQIYTNLQTYENQLKMRQMELHHRYYTAGQGVATLIAFLVFYFYLANYRPQQWRSIKVMTFLVCYITLFVILAILLFERFTYGIYLVPFAAVPIVVMVFFDARTGVMALVTTVLIAAMVSTFQYQFIFLEITAGLVATYGLRQLSKRSQLLLSALLAFITYAAGYSALLLLEGGSFEGFAPRALGMLAINSLLLSLAYFMILLIEKIFGFTSTVTLVELSDINNKLLRRLAEEAPGTFQHSMQVSTLAAEAARAIGANVQLVRTGALYHDIGKLESPVFFTENQHGANPNDGLPPEVSAGKIISHVTAGMQLANKAKLPAVIKAFISEHHGRGMAKYFYTMASNAAPDGAYVDPAPYTYPGPNPRSKETTLLMMADAVEASSRSLKDFSEDSISALVDKIIDGQEREGLYRDSPISFADLQTAKATFKRRLASIYHSRVSYPSLRHTATESGNGEAAT